MKTNTNLDSRNLLVWDKTQILSSVTPPWKKLSLLFCVRYVSTRLESRCFTKFIIVFFHNTRVVNRGTSSKRRYQYFVSMVHHRDHSKGQKGMSKGRSQWVLWKKNRSIKRCFFIYFVLYLFINIILNLSIFIYLFIYSYIYVFFLLITYNSLVYIAIILFCP